MYYLSVSRNVVEITKTNTNTWAVILMIVFAVLLVAGGIAFIVCHLKNKKINELWRKKLQDERESNIRILHNMEAEKYDLIKKNHQEREKHTCEEAVPCMPGWISGGETVSARRDSKDRAEQRQRHSISCRLPQRQQASCNSVAQNRRRGLQSLAGGQVLPGYISEEGQHRRNEGIQAPS